MSLLLVSENGMASWYAQILCIYRRNGNAAHEKKCPPASFEDPTLFLPCPFKQWNETVTNLYTCHFVSQKKSNHFLKNPAKNCSFQGRVVNVRRTFQYPFPPLFPILFFGIFYAACCDILSVLWREGPIVCQMLPGSQTCWWQASLKKKNGNQALQFGARKMLSGADQTMTLRSFLNFSVMFQSIA